MVAYVKSTGFTPSERFLSELCERSFLSLWSWPNIFHIKGKNKHELCDLLVVFGDHVLIFSDKNCELNYDKDQLFEDLEKQWKRWYKKSVLESYKQIKRAERYIKEHPERLFIDAACQVRLPEIIPKADQMVIHKIAIVSGAKKACIDFFGGGSGSLIQNTAIENDAMPFHIGKFQGEEFCHVFDETTLRIIMGELDTITDFTDYLTAKEKLFVKETAIHACGEEDLMAQYLHNTDKYGKHIFKYPDGYEGIFIPEGDWLDMQEHPAYLAKKQANRISYNWDSLIQAFNKNILDGTILGDEDINNGTQYGDKNVTFFERGVRELAAESRFARRFLAEALTSLFDDANGHERFARIVPSPSNSKAAYIFLILNNVKELDYTSYRRVRINLLHAYCEAYSVKNPKVEQITGLGFDAPNMKGGSEDLIFFPCDHAWTDDEIQRIKEDQQKFQILSDNTLKEYRKRDSEYPKAKRTKRGKLEGYNFPPNMNRKEKRRLLAEMRKSR